MDTTISTDEGFEKFMKTVGSGLRNVREAQKQDIDTVAKAVDIRSDRLDLIEQGKFNWDVTMIARLCKYYKVTVKEMLSNSDDIAWSPNYDGWRQD